MAYVENCHLVLANFQLRQPEWIRWTGSNFLFSTSSCSAAFRGQQTERQTTATGRKLFYQAIWALQSFSILTRKKNKTFVSVRHVWLKFHPSKISQGRRGAGAHRSCLEVVVGGKGGVASCKGVRLLQGHIEMQSSYCTHIWALTQPEMHACFWGRVPPGQNRCRHGWDVQTSDGKVQGGRWTHNLLVHVVHSATLLSYLPLSQILTIHCLLLDYWISLSDR